MARKVNLRRSDIDKSSYFWVRTCSACHPGGGPAEYDRKGNRYDEFARNPKNKIEPGGDNFLDGDYYHSDWAKSGVNEADCLLCHLKGYAWKARALALRGEFFSSAATVGAGWFRDLKKTTQPGSSKAPSFQIDYTQTKIADPENLAAFITKQVPDENCWHCHAGADRKKRGRSIAPEKDVHSAKGITCIYCHPAGEDHEIAKGDVLVGSVRDDIDNSMKGCADCHLQGTDPRAPEPEHSFSALHLKRISCETCHIPFKDDPAKLVMDNAITGKTVSYFTNAFLSNDPLDPNHHKQDIPENRWYPAFLKYKGKIKPVMPMQIVWWGDWDRAAHRVIPLFLWKIREMTGANANNEFSVTNPKLLKVLDGTKEVNTRKEIVAYLHSLSEAKDNFGCPLVCHTPVLVKGGFIYYLENGQFTKANLPKENGGFTCCEPFDLSHNVVSGKPVLGTTGCTDCHTSPSSFFNRKILADPFGDKGKPKYKEAWEILGYSKKELKKLVREVH